MHSRCTFEELRAEFWRAPLDSLLDRNPTSAGLGHSRRWLIDQELLGKAPPRVRVGKKWLYRKRDVLAFYGLLAEASDVPERDIRDGGGK